MPCDADGVTIVARPAGRPGEKAALFSNKYGQSTGVVVFDRVFVAWERVFLAGEWEHSAQLTYSYATHHRHTCIAARAGFGDLLIGAGALMCEANGFDPGAETHLREQMVQLITIVEGFYACGVAASVYASADAHSATVMPDPVFSNIGKLLLANQIYEMHRIAHYVSGGLIVTLPGPDEDHNPETAANLADVLRANPDVPYDKRIEAARFIEDLTASYQGGWYSVISLHGGGSPAAMKQEIWRNYPVGNKVELVERLLERGVLADPGPRDHRESAARQVLRHRLHAAGATTMVALPALATRRGQPMSAPAGDASPRSTAARSTSATRSGPSRPRLIDWQRRSTPSATTSRPPFVALVRRRHDQPLPQRGRSSPRRARSAARADLRLDRDRPASASTPSPSCTPRCSAWRRCCSALGVGRGDRVLIYMPMIPEAVVRDARVRAHRRDPFGRLRRLRERRASPSRIDDAEPTVIVSADAGSRAGKVIAYKPLLDEAIRLARAQAARRCCWSTAAWRRWRASPGATRTTPRCASAISTPTCPAPGSTRRIRATRSTPAARPAGRRACSATPAATRSRSPRA